MDNFENNKNKEINLNLNDIKSSEKFNLHISFGKENYQFYSNDDINK